MMSVSLRLPECDIMCSISKVLSMYIYHDFNDESDSTQEIKIAHFKNNCLMHWFSLLISVRLSLFHI